jgi:hypothetical protein
LKLKVITNKSLIIKFSKFLFALFALRRRGLNCIILRRRGMAFKDYSTFSIAKKGTKLLWEAIFFIR